jgi:dihydroorotase-like cyclic amidohydrolase
MLPGMLHLTLLDKATRGEPLSAEERAELGRWERLSEAEREAEQRALRAAAVTGSKAA